MTATMLPTPLPPSLAWHGDDQGELRLLDQTLLPHRIEVLSLRSAAAVAEAIQCLRVRGAPAIGVAAAYGLYLGLREQMPIHAAFPEAARNVAALLASSRPTAVNLRWALDRVLQVAVRTRSLAAVLAEARQIHQEDEDACERMGEHGQGLIQDGMTVLTHCNTGRLATAGLGTALAVLFTAARLGRRFTVLADETRPLLQGARLTALELAAAGIPVELLADAAAPGLIARGAVDLVLVGADRIASNGDFANKVGTYGLALACLAHKVPFYVVAPRSTFDPALPDGRSIPIEDRAAAEVLTLAGQPLAPAGVGARNPAFDLTPGRLVTGIVTECGILQQPLAPAIKALLAQGR